MGLHNRLSVMHRSVQSMPFKILPQLGIALIMLGLAAAAQAQERLPEASFAVDTEIGFQPVPDALSAYLKAQKAAAGKHQFCVIGYALPQAAGPELKIAWVHWAQGKRLVYWEQSAPDVASRETLLLSRRNLNLKKDVAPKGQSAQGSTYLVQSQWVDALLADCKRRGKNYLIHHRK